MRYTPTHEWAYLEDGCAFCGISSHAQKELGEIVYIELPKLGAKVQAGDLICILESTKAACDTYAPLSGEVIATHDVIAATPSLLTSLTEKEGWLYKLKLTSPQQYDALLTSASYSEMMG